MKTTVLDYSILCKLCNKSDIGYLLDNTVCVYVADRLPSDPEL